MLFMIHHNYNILALYNKNDAAYNVIVKFLRYSVPNYVIWYHNHVILHQQMQDGTHKHVKFCLQSLVKHLHIQYFNL